jgi:hypothetical protein
MRSGVIVTVLALALAGCGGGTMNVAKSARPCLERLGQYVHHVPRKLPTQTAPILPLADPTFRPTANQLTQSLAWPKDMQEYGEVLYPLDQPGANALQILIFADDELPRKIERQAHEPNPRLPGAFFVPGRQTARIGQTILLWSSRPTAKQRRAVRACLE